MNALYRRSKADETGVGNASHHDKVLFWIPAHRNLLFIFGPSLQCFPPRSGSLLSHSFSVSVSVVTVSLLYTPFLQVLRSCHCLVTCSLCRPRMHGKYGPNGGSFIVSSSHVSPESFLILKRYGYLTSEGPWTINHCTELIQGRQRTVGETVCHILEPVSN